MGYITPQLLGKFPGYLSFSNDVKFADIPVGLGAFSKVPAAGWFEMVCYCLYCEGSTQNWIDKDGNFDFDSSNMKKGAVADKRAPGDYGWKPPLLATDDAETKKRRLAAELANGRLAMMAIIGMFMQDGLTGSAWGDWALYTASPLRAFENELGVQAPVGFWDPIGLSKDGDVEDFKRRRETEIKHGRVCMFACIGYIVPEYTKLPGFLAPSIGLKFADVPNGLAALGKVPLEGWLQITALGGFYELCVNNEVNGEPGNYGKGFLGITGKSIEDSAKRTRSLNAEIANGRLAMTAIMGMMFQNGVTGSTDSM